MPPAFLSSSQAVRFLCTAGLLLVSPVLLRTAGPPSRAEAYKAVPLAAGEYPYIERQLFEESSPVDMVFVCSSLLAAGIDAPTVQKELSRALGRQANVVLLSVNWQGLDLQYTLLRDLVDHRKARMVVMSMPIPEYTSDRPHLQAFRWLRFGDFPEVVGQLPWQSRFMLYSENVLGAGRQWLTLLRPNLTDAERADSKTFGTVYDWTSGYYGAPFVEEDRQPPAGIDGTIYSPDTASRFHFGGRPLGPYQLTFAREIGTQIRRSGAWLTLLHIPVADERGSGMIPERMYWPDVIRVPMTIAGIPSGVLYAEKNDEQYYHYFSDQHMNTNGKMLFSRAIAPTLARIYVQHIH
jgi:hypothetical protein